MEPRIQYAKTEDGVSIAFWTMGKGPPLVRVSNIPFSHIQWMWQHIPVERAVAEAIAGRATYVQYDCRGSGSSTRDVADLSLEAHLTDLTAVVDRLGLERFPLMTNTYAGPVAIAYAVRHPERLTHLILQNSYARYSDLLATPEGQTFKVLREGDWTIHTETGAHILTDWSAEAAQLGAEFFRASISQEGALAAFREIEKFDVTDLLPDVQIPTLVTHGGLPSIDWPPANLSRELAAQIPGAELVIAESLGEVFAAVSEFLGVEADGTTFESQTAQPDTAVILFLDIADSTALTTKLGDAAYRERERELDASLRAAITEAGGTPVEGKVLGDGIMSVFTSARQAIEAAQSCRDLGNDADLPLCLGIHAGDVVREGNNVHGGAIQVASRVVDLAEPGEILVSATVRDLARTSAGVAFEDRGEHELKGIPEPQRLFAVREQD